MFQFFDNTVTSVINTIAQKKDIVYQIYLHNPETHVDYYVCELVGRDLPDIEERYGLKFKNDDLYGWMSLNTQDCIRQFVYKHGEKEVITAIDKMLLLILRINVAPEKKQERVIEMQPF